MLIMAYHSYVQARSAVTQSHQHKKHLHPTSSRAAGNVLSASRKLKTPNFLFAQLRISKHALDSSFYRVGW